jgi:hypothetical protein
MASASYTAGNTLQIRSADADTVFTDDVVVAAMVSVVEDPPLDAGIRIVWSGIDAADDPCEEAQAARRMAEMESTRRIETPGKDGAETIPIGPSSVQHAASRAC